MKIVMVLIGVIIIVGFGEVASRILFPHWRDFSNQRFTEQIATPRFGTLVIGKPGFKGHFAQNNGDFRVEIRINNAGLRNELDARAANGRVWVVGDSMTFGWGVEAPEIYGAIAETITGMPSYNVASPGTDVCGYRSLTDRLRATSRPAAIVVGFIMENDVSPYDCLARGQASGGADGADAGSGFSSPIMRLKRILTASSALYNFGAVTVKRFPLIVESLIDLGLINRPHGDRFAPAPENHAQLVKATVAEFVQFRKRWSDVPFAVLIAPTRIELRDDDQDQKNLRQLLVRELRARNIDVIDPFDRFKKIGMVPTHFTHDGHWSPLGHRLAGEAMAEWLQKKNIKQGSDGPR